MRHAFTLIELLVVVSIIGVLAAVLLPAISQVRSHAHSAKCLSNLRQIGMVAEIYSQDWEGRVVWMSSTSVGNGGDGLGPWYRRLAPYLDMRNPTTANFSDKTQPNIFSGCPSWEKARSGAEMSALAGYTIHTDLGYGFNRNLDRPHSWAMNHYPGPNPNPSEHPFRDFTFDRIRNASQRPLIADWYSLWLNGNAPDWHYLTRAGAARHRGLGNVLFCDLHVRSLVPLHIKLGVMNPALVP